MLLLLHWRHGWRWGCMTAGYACLRSHPLRWCCGCACIHACYRAIWWRWWLTFAAGYWTVDSTTSRQKCSAQQWAATCIAWKAFIRGMPMLAVMTHLSLIHTNGFSTKITVLGKHGIEAKQTIRLTLAHNIALAAQLLFTFMTGKMIHMPGTSFSFGAFISQDNLRKKKKKKHKVLKSFSCCCHKVH